MTENKGDGSQGLSVGLGGFFVELVKIFILAFIIIVPIRTFLFQPFFVQGASMEPNFEDGQYLIINEFGHKTTEIGLGNRDFFTVKPFKDLDRQDVIVFRYPRNPGQFFIKRIIGLPGERVVVKDGEVFLYNEQNPEGIKLDESSYLSSDVMTPGSADITLTDSEYFVMGDNRKASHDSRSWGPLPDYDVIGKVFLRAWPIGEAAIF